MLCYAISPPPIPERYASMCDVLTNFSQVTRGLMHYDRPPSFAALFVFVPSLSLK